MLEPVYRLIFWIYNVVQTSLNLQSNAPIGTGGTSFGCTYIWIARNRNKLKTTPQKSTQAQHHAVYLNTDPLLVHFLMSILFIVLFSICRSDLLATC